jgi:hypothetical protein
MARRRSKRRIIHVCQSTAVFRGWMVLESITVQSKTETAHQALFLSHQFAVTVMDERGGATVAMAPAYHLPFRICEMVMGVSRREGF